MPTYRIFTERTARRNTVLEAVSRLLPGFTEYHATGYWQGKPEESMVIEVTGNASRRQIERVAKLVKRLNRQESVLVSRIVNESWSV